MARIDFFVPLFPGKLDFVSVDNDDMVTTISVRGVARLVLSPYHHRDFTRETTQNSGLSIYQHPLLLDSGSVGGNGFVA